MVKITMTIMCHGDMKCTKAMRCVEYVGSDIFETLKFSRVTIEPICLPEFFNFYFIFISFLYFARRYF